MPKELEPKEIFKEEFQKALSKLEKQFDLAYFEVKIILTEYSENFEKWKEETIIDTHQKTYCVFCGKEAYFYDQDKHIHLCAKCYRDLNDSKN